MPAKSLRQQRAAGADVGRCRQGDAPRTFPTCTLAKEFAHRPPEGYSKAQKKSTKGSPAFTDQELSQGFRKIE